MSEIAVWTDSDGKVDRIHNRPNTVDTSGSYLSNNKPSYESGTADWVEDELYYDEQNDEFYYQSTDPFEGLSLSDSKKQNLYNAIKDNDLLEARNIVEEVIQL